MENRMAGKNLYICGGSRGIGFCCAQLALQEGVNAVAIVSEHPETREAALKQLREEFPGRNIEGYTYDVGTATEEEIGKTMKDFIAKYPNAEGKEHLDAVIVTAGISNNNTIKNVPDGLWDRVMAVNLDGTYKVDRQAALIMNKQRYGSIVNTASVAGVYGNRMGCAYGASKAGVIGLTKSLAREEAYFNVRINVVCPGCIDTDLGPRHNTPEAREYVCSTIALNRIGQPEEIAHMFMFLASDEASYCCGGTYHYDGWTTL